MDKQLQKIIDPDGIEITKGIKVTDDEFEGYVINISEAFIDYSDEAQRAVMHCPKIEVHTETGDKESYDTHWDGVGAAVMGRQMVFVCDDLEVIE